MTINKKGFTNDLIETTTDFITRVFPNMEMTEEEIPENAEKLSGGLYGDLVNDILTKEEHIEVCEKALKNWLKNNK